MIKTRTLVYKAIILSLMNLAVQAAAIAASTTLTLQPDSTLLLSGDSTLHPFNSHATKLHVSAGIDESRIASAAMDSDIQKAVLQNNALQTFELTVPVEGLKSKEASMDKNMYKTLKAEQYPNIIFRLSRYTISPSTRTASASHVQALGQLEISGKARSITMDMEAIPGTSAIQVDGQYALSMMDYGIRPPTLMMGAIKVKDRVVIRFSLHLGVSSGSNATK